MGHREELQVMSRPADGLLREGGALQVWMGVLMVRRYSGWCWDTGYMLPLRGQGTIVAGKQTLKEGALFRMEWGMVD